MRLQQLSLMRRKVWAFTLSAISILFFVGLAIHSVSAPTRVRPTVCISSLRLDDPPEPCDDPATAPVVNNYSFSDPLSKKIGGKVVATVTVFLNCQITAETKVKTIYIKCVQPDCNKPTLILPCTIVGGKITDGTWPQLLTFSPNGTDAYKANFKIHLAEDPIFKGGLKCETLPHIEATLLQCDDKGKELSDANTGKIIVNPSSGPAGGGGNAQPISVGITANNLVYTKQRQTDVTVELSALLPAPPSSTAAGQANLIQDNNAVLVTCDKEHRNILAPLNADGTVGSWPYRLQVGLTKFPKFKMVMTSPLKGAISPLNQPVTANATLYTYALATEPDFSAHGSSQHGISLSDE